LRRRLALAAALAASIFASALVPSAAGRPTVRASVTSNWAGYAAIGPGSSTRTASPDMSFTDVTGQWREPRAICNGTPTSVAIWVGLGGYSLNASALEQAGTAADCHANGKPSYYAWYELVPADSVTVGLRVNPGDVIASSVVVNGTDVLVQVIDRTRKKRFTKHLTMPAPDLTSAEWIAEAPEECNGGFACNQLALTDFGAVSFTRSFAKGNDVGGTISGPSWLSRDLQLVPRATHFGQRDDPASQARAAGASTSPLDATGTRFTIAWQQHPAPADSGAGP
jgi:Peptidase A4 family